MDLAIQICVTKSKKRNYFCFNLIVAIHYIKLINLIVAIHYMLINFRLVQERNQYTQTHGKSWREFCLFSLFWYVSLCFSPNVMIDGVFIMSLGLVKLTIGPNNKNNNNKTLFWTEACRRVPVCRLDKNFWIMGPIRLKRWRDAISKMAGSALGISTLLKVNFKFCEVR